MRVILLLLCGLFMQQNGWSQSANKAFTFTGTIANTPTGYVYLSYVDSANHYVEDSTQLNSGKFSFKGYINGPAQANFHGKTASRSGDDPKYADIFLEPGKIQASFSENDFKHAGFTGSKSQLQYTNYQKQTDELDAKWKSVLAASNAYRNNVDVAKNKVIAAEGLPRYHAEQEQLSRQFIRQHPQSHVSAYLLQYEKFHMPLDSLRIYYTRFAPDVQTGMEGAAIGNFIRKEESIAIGKPAPDFMQPDSSGAPVWLHDFKGQYVLLDIWVSWCVPCRAEHPYLRQAYAQYKNKGFVILSLSMDKKVDKQAWTEAIQKDSLSWPQLCDFTVYQNKVVNDYNVLGKGIPSNFLISPQGTIIAMNLRGEAVEKKLAEMMTN